MNAYFSFTDESGNYQRERTSKYLKAHPFYVRATVIISLDDYLVLQTEMDKIKESFGLASEIEVKWSHYGSALKNNYSKIPHRLTAEQLQEYYDKVLLMFSTLKSACVYYTLTENQSVGSIQKTKLIKMHLQNALQRIQANMEDQSGFSIVIADDLNEETKALKQAVYELTLAGDFIQYTSIKKGLYIDYSNQCQGLQITDICAGTFTATLKYESVPNQEKYKFKVGHDLFMRHAYKATRCGTFYLPAFEVYRYGVKEVPKDSGSAIAKKISNKIASKLENDLRIETHELFQ